MRQLEFYHSPQDWINKTNDSSVFYDSQDKIYCKDLFLIKKYSDNSIVHNENILPYLVLIQKNLSSGYPMVSQEVVLSDYPNDNFQELFL